MIKDYLIHALQDEVIFLQQTKLTDDELERYVFKLKGDLSESRTFNLK